MKLDGITRQRGRDCALEWPPDRFFWCILDAPGPVSRRRQVRSGSTEAAQLAVLLEEDLPAPPESVHAIYLRLDERRVLACAVARDELRSVPQEITVFRPSGVPPFVAEVCRVSAAELNFLVGGYEAPAITREATARQRIWMWAVVAACLLMTWGFQRRERRWLEAGRVADRAFQAAARELEPDVSVPLVSIPVQIGRELQELRTLSAMPRPDALSRADGVRTLEAVLTGWPRDADTARPDVISISGDSVAMSVQVAGDPQAFIAGFTPPRGWSLEPPRLTAARGQNQLSLQLRRVVESGGAR